MANNYEDLNDITWPDFLLFLLFGAGWLAGLGVIAAGLVISSVHCLFGY